MNKIKGITTRQNSIQISFMYKGDRIRETLRLEPTKSNLVAANRIRQAALRDIELGKFEYSAHFPNSPNANKYSSLAGSLLKIEDALNEWLRVHQKRLSMSTIRDYNSAVTHHLIPTFGHLFLTELSVKELRKWMNSMTISNKRINNIMTPLRMIYADAYENEVIAKNPLSKIKNLPISTREPEPFNEIEIERILSHLSGQNRNLIQLAFWTGMRTSELIGLRWEDIDFEKRKIHVRRAIVRNNIKEPKTKSGIRSIEINEHAYSALSSQQKETGKLKDYVFLDTNTGKHLDDQKIRKRIWRPALMQAGIKYREPYQTRHTFASMMLMQHKTPFWVSRQMGHSSPNQTYKSYARWID